MQQRRVNLNRGKDLQGFALPHRSTPKRASETRRVNLHLTERHYKHRCTTSVGRNV